MQMRKSRKREWVERLRRGREFHRLIQDEWRKTAEGEITPEKGCTKPGGRRGFMDIYVHPDERDPKLTAVVEVKGTDWDGMSVKAVKRNVRRQVKQIWDYIESELASDREPCPGVIFPKRPADPAKRAYIEKTFNENGIQVVWHDEPTPVSLPDPSMAKLFDSQTIFKPRRD